MHNWFKQHACNTHSECVLHGAETLLIGSIHCRFTFGRDLIRKPAGCVHQAVNLLPTPKWWECETWTALRSSLNPNMYTYLSDEREEKENKRTGSNIWKSELLRWQPVPKSISDLWSNYGFGSSWNHWMMWGLGSVGLESWLPRLCHAACQPPLQLHAASRPLLSLLSVFGFFALGVDCVCAFVI